jgi:hypothetical protein
MIKNFLNNLLLSILQRIPYVQKLEAERDKAILELNQLELENLLLFSILQRIPYMQKLEAERGKAISELNQLELENLGIEYEDTDVPRGKRNV